MQIFFNDASNNQMEVTKLHDYLERCKSKVNQNYVFGQKGSRLLDPSSQNDRNSLIGLQIIPSIYTPEYEFMQQVAEYNSKNKSSGTQNSATGLNEQTYNSSTRGTLEGILSSKIFYFVYDLVSNQNAMELSVTNQFSSPVADMINNLLNSPITQVIGTIGGGTGADIGSLVNAIGGVFGVKGAGSAVSDIFSTLFLSKVKTVELWQGGDIKFQIPAQFTLLDYNGNPFDNVIFPSFLLYLMAGYNRIPFGAVTETSKGNGNNWIAEISSILRFVIGPMYFKLQVGNFMESDENNPFAISNLDIKFSGFINGLPTVQMINMTIENVNPIVIEDIAAVGEQDKKPIVTANISSATNTFNFNYSSPSLVKSDLNNIIGDLNGI